MLAILTEVADHVKDSARANNSSGCVMEFWATESLSREANGKPGVSSADMACTVLDFLFASQDATTSALVWALDVLNEHPKCLAKIKAELRQVRAANPGASLCDIFPELKYRMAA